MADAARAQITQGALNAIFNDPDTLQRKFPVPVCQCVQIKALGNPGEGNPERYRLVLSDISNFVQSMLATQANHVVHEEKLKKGSIVRLKSYQANSVKGKRILIIMDLEVIESLGELEKIGEPVALTVKEEDDAKPTNTTIAGNGFYGPKAEQSTRQERVIPSHSGPKSSAGGNAHIWPIEGLSPYQQRWTIKARVTQKSDIKTWNKPNSEGKLFSVNLLDESGEIRATGFNEQCDMFYDLLQEGQVYYISSCKVIMAKKQFSNLNNDYEIMFERESVIEKCEDQDQDVPQIRYNFVSIGNLNEIEKDSTIDVIGILKEVGDVDQITSKNSGKSFDKRELTLVDDSGFSVRLTVWGKTAASFDVNPESVLAFKGLKVSEFNGRSLSMASSGSMAIDPDIPEAHKIKGWYDAQGRTENFASHMGMAGAGEAGGRKNEIKTMAEVKEENLGMSEKPDYFQVKATIIFIKQEMFSYPACLKEKCNKKVTDLADGTWRCEECNINHPKPEHRYIMSLNATDHTGQLWMSAFDDVGRLVMGMSADDLMELKENDTAAMEKAFDNANCKTFHFRVRAKMDTFQEQQRVRYQVQGATPINFVTEAHKLASLIKSYNID